MKRVIKWSAIAVAILLAIGLLAGYTPDTDPQAMRAKYANANSQFVDVGNGLKIHVRDQGSRTAPPVILIHGSNASLHTWEPWVARLGGKYRIITLDMPGHGLTGADPDRDYHYARFVEVVDAVARKIGVKQFAIGGNSMGGGIAWHYALIHPEKVTALILIDAAGVPEWQSTKNPIGFRIARMPVIRNFAKYITPRPIIASSLDTSVSNKAVATDAAIDRYWDLLRYPGNRQATLDRFALVHNVEPATVGEMAQIKVPTLVMWGQEDGLIPVSSARWFADKISNAQLIVYPGIGHIPMEELPDRSARDFDNFLGDADRSGGLVERRLSGRSSITTNGGNRGAKRPLDTRRYFASCAR